MATEKITREEWRVSEEYIARIKEDNANFAAMHGRPRLAHTETYGCQQNVNDTERIRGMLDKAGFGLTENAEEADLIIYNTCAVRENAEQKVFGRLGILKHMKEDRPELMVAVCGCMVQQEHITEKLRKVHDHVDLIFGTHALWRMPELLYKAMRDNGVVVDITESDGAIVEDMPILRDKEQKAWVSVMYGCNNFCTYCIVPYVRGRERSRDPEDIMAEIRCLVENGTSEISLLGQNVNSYGKDLGLDIDFADLLRMVNDVEGVKRIRFMTSHPKDLTDKLIYTIRDCDKVCKQLHLPFQAGSDKILKQMNRHYTREQYLGIIDKVKKEIPGIALTTDVIVGFPTETNEDFRETMDIINYVRYDSIFSFIYSRREGTPAAKLDFVLSDEEIHKNFDELLRVQNQICKEKNLEYVGRTKTVLVDGASKTDKTLMTGRTDSGKIVNFAGSPDLVGKYIEIEITKAKQWSLEGEMIK